MSRQYSFVFLSYHERRRQNVGFLSLDLLDISHTVSIRPPTSRRVKDVQRLSAERGARNHKTRHVKGDSDGNGSPEGSVVGSVTVGATRVRRHLYGDDCEHAVRLDF